MALLLCGIAITAAQLKERALLVPSEQPADLAERLLGESRRAVGAHFYEQADAYFHGGVPHTPPVAADTLFRRWRERLIPEAHAHIADNRIAEIMPWLRMATATDPRNVEAHLVAAYWLDRAIGRRDAAEELLRSALRKNPRDYRLRMELGRLCIRHGEWAGARDHLKTALAQWADQPLDDPEQHALDRAEILTYLGYLEEAAGRLVSAAEAYETVARDFPNREGLLRRAQMLRTGEQPPESAEQILRFLAAAENRHVCDRESHHHDADGDADLQGQGRNRP